MLRFLILGLVILSASCSDEPEEPLVQPVDPALERYFPQGDDWSTLSFEDIGWDVIIKNQLDQWVTESNTRALLILKGGKIAYEQYNGESLIGRPFNQESIWQWNSAGKTLTSSMIGIAAEEGLLNLDEPSQNHLGENWSSLTSEQENDITIRDHLQMTTGLDDNFETNACTTRDCLNYLSSPGDRWAYHNAPYTLLQSVISNATMMESSDYFNEKIAEPIGMTGIWRQLDFNIIYFSKSRDMARYGLLVANDGNWDGNQIIPKDYLAEATSPSQNLNNSYGYLWWLNGQKSYMLPSTRTVFEGPMIPAAPDDMFMAIGRNSQVIMIIPSEDIVVIRMGEAGNDDLVGLGVIRSFWSIFSNLI